MEMIAHHTKSDHIKPGEPGQPPNQLAKILLLVILKDKSPIHDSRNRVDKIGSFSSQAWSPHA
jgi:hypothetical protein